jgi:hypothetical protein
MVFIKRYIIARGAMNVKTRRIFAVIQVLIVSGIAAGCGLSPGKQASTSAALTAEAVAAESSPAPIPVPTHTPTPTPEPTSTPISITTFEDMEGVWSRTYRASEFRLTVHKGGGITHVELPFIQDVRIPDIWFEDGQLHIQETTSTCSRDQIGIYEVTGVLGEYLIFTVVDDPCAVYRNFRGKWTAVTTP